MDDQASEDDKLKRKSNRTLSSASKKYNEIDSDSDSEQSKINKILGDPKDSGSEDPDFEIESKKQKRDDNSDTG